MALNSRDLDLLVHVIIIVVFLSSSATYGTDTDIFCLKTLKNSIEDPLNILNKTWNFANPSEGFICKFTGIECWHEKESKVLNIRLSSMGLKGNFPHGFENCTSLTGLDLSYNNFSGPISSNISSSIRSITKLDLSFNQFSGEIPANLANLSYLNELKLDSNQLSGNIPLQLGLLDRIKIFSVSNNLLTGQVPQFVKAVIPQENYANNPGLCGEPLKPCTGSSKKISTAIIAGAGVGAVIFTAIVVGIGFYYCSRRVAIKKKDEDLEGNKWARIIKGRKGIKVSMFEKPVTKMRLSNLMEATNNFSKSNIIGLGRTGTTYKAILPEGSHLMVKRLQENQHTEKEFISEMNTLGNIKHRNLVPLLGYCITEKERFLVYKFMSKGTLYDNLHPTEPEVQSLDWPTRLKIAIGTAKGLAWLHHNCNPRIIHRNISSKCILLDEIFEPRLSDFGLARLMNPLDTHLSTFVNGEFGDLGYVAPEYPNTLVATPKGDVFGFGTVLLELITGEKPTHVSDNAPEPFKGSLVEWVTKLARDKALESAIDKSFVFKGYGDELKQFLRIGFNCVSTNPKDRPTMFEVYQLLRAIGERYGFSTDDDVLMVSNSGNSVYPNEFIVSMEKSKESY